MSVSPLTNNCKEKKKDCQKKFTPMKMNEEVLSNVSGGNDDDILKYEWQCCLCGEMFYTTSAYKYHVKTKHPERA